MRLVNSLGPAAMLLASAVYGQTPPPTPPPKSSPPTNLTTGGTQPAPTSPATGGKAPPTVVFPTDLFRMNDVSKSINLTDRQLSQLNLITERLQTRYREQFDHFAGLPARERADRTLQLNRDYTNAWISGASDVLNAQQLTRYQQLQTQFGGFFAMTDPVAQKALSLTDTQLARLRDDVTWSDQKLAAIRQQAAVDQARALQMFNTFNEASQLRLRQLLTVEQQRAWAQLTGDPFVFPPPFPVTPATTGGTPPKQ